MIIDETTIKIKAGNGGEGHVSFRREKYVPRGGPDGGDGGKGGNIYFRGNSSLNTLTNFASTRNYHAEDGLPGGTNQKSGHSGEDMFLDVPPGTLVFNLENGQKIADITEDKMQVRMAKGGRGGWGNVHFKSATNQTPQEFNPGEQGQEFNLRLELKMIADIGLIGFPNAGKSTLLSRISKATPKIADYPFTTLEPNLGVASFHDKHFVFADIPGLIEGASEGKGLGIKFLKHIERTKVLAHLIDINEPDIAQAYNTIRQELKKYSEILSNKYEIIVINKIDTISKEDLKIKIKELKKELPKETILYISAAAGLGLDDLLKEISKLLTRNEENDQKINEESQE